MSITVLLAQGSLTDGHETVWVNASNTNADLGSGVSGAISRACGRGFQQQLHLELQQTFHGPMVPGQVLMTPAGNHPRAKWIVHVAVMDYREGFTGTSFPTLETIRTGCSSLWDAVERLPGNEPLSVAMVALGAGTGNLGVREPTRIAAQTLQAHLASHPGSRIGKVVFYGYALEEFVAMAEVLLPFFPELKERLPSDVIEFLERQPSG